MRIIAINASPRKGGNTEIALQTALDEAKSQGAETELYNIEEMDINAWTPEDKDDDMKIIMDDILKADGVIFGSPIYFADVTAQAKIFIDRLYPFYVDQSNREKFEEQKWVIVASQGMDDSNAFLPALKLQAGALKEAIGFNVVDIKVLTENLEPGAINSKDEQIELAKEIGKLVL